MKEALKTLLGFGQSNKEKEIAAFIMTLYVFGFLFYLAALIVKR